LAGEIETVVMAFPDVIGAYLLLETYLLRC